MAILKGDGQSSKKWIGFLIAAATVLIGGCAGSEEEQSDAPAASATAGNLSLTKQPAEMTPNEFAALPLMNKVDYVGPILNTDAEGTRTRLNAALDSLGYAGYGYFDRPIVQPSLSNTTQEISDQITLAHFQAWELSNQGSLRMDEALKIADVTTRGREYGDLTALLGKQRPLISLGLAWEQTREQLPKRGEYEEFDSAISYTEQNILSKDPYNPEYVKVTVGFKKGNQDNSGIWILIKTNDAKPPLI